MEDLENNDSQFSEKVIPACCFSTVLYISANDVARISEYETFKFYIVEVAFDILTTKPTTNGGLFLTFAFPPLTIFLQSEIDRCFLKN